MDRDGKIKDWKALSLLLLHHGKETNFATGIYHSFVMTSLSVMLLYLIRDNGHSTFAVLHPF